MTQIQDKFLELLQNGLNLGDTLGIEESFPDGGNRQVYEFGAIYFHPRVGVAFESHGLILEIYRQLGEHRSSLGYPTSDELVDPNILLGSFNTFEGGTLNFDPAIGVTPQFDEPILLPQITVKFFEGLPVFIGQGIELGLDIIGERLGLFTGHPLLEAVRVIFPDLAFRRLFDSVSSEEIEVMVSEATAQDPEYQPPSFEHFLAIDCPFGVDVEALAAAFRLWSDFVQHAYVTPVPEDAGVVVATSNPLFFSQGHLTAIGVKKAWDRGADGTDTRFIDIERGWQPNHEDLPPFQLLGGQNLFSSYGHGAAVLGTVAALDNGAGGVGIAPKASADVISYFLPTRRGGSTRTTLAIASAVLQAGAKLTFGDVLLLEAETFVSFDGGPGHPDNGKRLGAPAEVDVAIYDAIRLLTRRNIIVIEAAGNTRLNLDAYRDGGVAILARGGRTDSGAIVVGACSPTTNQSWVTVDPTLGSNTGTRIDCCAWGDGIVSPGRVKPPFPPNCYLTGAPPDGFMGGTSGAAAIITGICLLIQNLAAPTGRLAPAAVRAILANPINGTAVNGGVIDPVSGTVISGVGPMPNLERIVTHHFP